MKISLKYEDGVETEIECDEFVLVAWNGDLERRGPAVVHCSGDASIPEPRLEVTIKVLAEAMASSMIPRAKALGMLLTAAYNNGLQHLDDFLSKSVLEG